MAKTPVKTLRKDKTVTVTRVLRKGTKVVDVSAVSQMSMVAGNETHLETVVHDGSVKTWVGIGWIVDRVASASDYDAYPVVIEGNE